MTLALKLPERLPLGFDLVSAEAYLEISEADYNAIRQQTAIKETEGHGSIGDEVVIAGTPLALRGLIGVHDYRESKDVAQITQTGFICHYSIELEGDVTAYKENEGWDKLSDALSNTIPKHASHVRLQQFFAPGKVVPATSLPIPLGEAGVSGFTEIRGVRLAQSDPESKKQLYSVILELTGDGGYSMNTMTFIESRVDGDLLTKAISRLAEISGLAYKEVAAQ